MLEQTSALRGVTTEAFLDGYMQSVNDIIHVFIPMLDELSEKEQSKIKTQLSMAFDQSFAEYVRRKPDTDDE